MQKPTLPIAIAIIIALASIFVAALQTTTIFPPPSTRDELRYAKPPHHEDGAPLHGHGHHPLRRHEPKPNENSSTSSNTAETNPFPALPPIPPVLRFDLSSTATVNISPYLTKDMTNGSNIPVVLDTLSSCSWLATVDMRCADFDSLSTGSTASTTNSNITDSNHRDNSTTAGRCVQSVHDGDFVPAVTLPRESQAATDETTTVRRSRRRCSHYLAGEVSGTVAAVPLRLSSAMLAGGGGGAGSESSLLPSSESAAVIRDARDDEVSMDVVLATTFSAGPGLLFGDFQRYYGGGSGVVGLGLGLSVDATQQSGNSISDPVVGADNDDENRRMTSQGLLASIFSSWSWHHVDTKRRFGLALPRDGEVGVFTIGGSVRELVVDGSEANEKLADEVVLATSIIADGAETAADGRGSAGAGFGGLYSIDLANVTFQASDSASSQASADVPGDVVDGGDGDQRERYYIDTALPIIWTSEYIAAAIAAQFDPPGWFEPTTRAATNSSSNSTTNNNSTAESRQTNASSSWTKDTGWNASRSTTTTTSNNNPPPPPQQHRPGLFRVSCNATPPNTMLHLDDGTSSVSVPIYPPDMIVRMRLRTDEARKCMSAFQSGDVVSAPQGGGGGERKVQVKLRRLGWPFLRNVLLDFDLGAGAGAGAAAGGGGGRVGVGIRTWPPDTVAVDAAGREDGNETGTGNWNGNRTRVSTRSQTSATTATATATSTTTAVPSTSTSSTLVTSTRTLTTNDTGAAPPGEGHEIQPSLTLTLTSASISASTPTASPSSSSLSSSPEDNTFTAPDSSPPFPSSSSSPLPNITFPTTAAIHPSSGGEPQQPRPRPNHLSDQPENDNLPPR